MTARSSQPTMRRRVCPLVDGQRFMRHVARHPAEQSGCWLWTGSLTTNGYGRFHVGGKRIRAHRWSIVNLGGRPIPAGRVVDHLCDVRQCVNPDHLAVVSSRHNTLRGTSASAVNARKLQCPAGHPYDWTGARGQRRCRACHRTKKREVRQRRRQGKDLER